mgnify:CR=1 FL=1
MCMYMDLYMYMHAGASLYPTQGSCIYLDLYVYVCMYMDVNTYAGASNLPTLG